LTYKDWNLKFDSTAKEVQASVLVEESSREVPGRLSPKLEYKSHSNSQRLAYIWSYLIQNIRNRLVEIDKDPLSRNDVQVLEYARQQSIITTEQFNALNGLRVMRNLAVHSPRGEIEEDKYEEFKLLADAMITILGLPSLPD
jgi:hypothetical protein